MSEFENDLMTEEERRNYLFLQAFYLKVKNDVAELESKLNRSDDPEGHSYSRDCE
jgi:hypothetical protein